MEWLWLKCRHNWLCPRQIISSRKGALTPVSETISLHSCALKPSGLFPKSSSSSLSARRGRWCLSQGRGDGAITKPNKSIKTGGWEKGRSSFNIGIPLQPFNTPWKWQKFPCKHELIWLLKESGQGQGSNAGKLNIYWIKSTTSPTSRNCGCKSSVLIFLIAPFLILLSCHIIFIWMVEKEDITELPMVLNKVIQKDKWLITTTQCPEPLLGLRPEGNSAPLHFALNLLAVLKISHFLLTQVWEAEGNAE